MSERRREMESVKEKENKDGTGCRRCARAHVVIRSRVVREGERGREESREEEREAGGKNVRENEAR